MSKQNIYYQVRDFDDDYWYEMALEEQDYVCDRWAAQACAQNYCENHGGFDMTWPLLFKLKRTIDDIEFTTFRLILECEPVFYAQKI